MNYVDEHYTDALARVCLTEFIPKVTKPLDLKFIKDGVQVLLQNCQTAAPKGPWLRIRDIDFSDDVRNIKNNIHQTQSTFTSKLQISLADVTFDEPAGEITLFTDSKHFLGNSTFAIEVEALIADYPEEIQQWGHWHLLLGYLTLITLQSVAPIEILESANGPGFEKTTCYSVGLHDNLNFFIGLSNDNNFFPLLEWN